MIRPVHAIAAAAMLHVTMPAAVSGSPPMFEGSFLASNVGRSLQSLVVADFDHDGHQDVAVVEAPLSLPRGVRVAFGHGDGTLTAGPLFPAGVSPTGMIGRDLTGDGELDLIVIDTGQSMVSFLAGLGDGSFTAPVGVSTAPGPRALTLGDLDADGIDDLVVVCSGSNVVSVRPGTGGGAFGPGTDLSVPTVPKSIAIATLDGDTIPDLVVTLPDWNGIAMFRGQGDATFQPAIIQAVGARPDSVAVMDVDLDGHNDLVLTAGGNVRTLKGAGDGTFGSGVWHPLPSYYGDGAAGSLLLGDIDLDGRLDVAVTQPQGGRVAILFGAPGGGLIPAVATATMAQATGLAAADMNGDGLVDLLTFHDSGLVCVLPSRGNGLFGTGLLLSTSGPAARVELVDLTGDGRSDIVYTSSPLWKLVGTFASEPGGGFGPRREHAVGGPAGFAIGDFDGDGVPDLVVANTDTDSLSLLRGLGDGSFGPRSGMPTGVAPYAVCTADFDLDGNLDIATTCYGDELVIHAGNGDGTFAGGVPYATGYAPLDVHAADVNEDGMMDLVVAPAFDYRLNVFLGRGDNTFDPMLRTGVVNQPNQLALGDYDEDGHLDAIAMPLGANSMRTLLGAGDGTFELSEEWWGGAPQHVRSADVDGDGHLDLVMANYWLVSIMLGRGDGTFTDSGIWYGTPIGANRLAVGDVDADGRLDVVVAGLHAEGVFVIRNVTPATTGIPRPSTSMATAPLALYLSPNPAHTAVDLRLETRAGATIDLAIYDLAGRRLASPTPRPIAAGSYRARWDRSDALGRRAPAGVYFAVLRDGALRVTRRIVVLD